MTRTGSSVARRVALLLLGSAALAAVAPPGQPVAVDCAVIGATGLLGVAILRRRAAALASRLDRNQRDLDAVVLANVELRHVADAGDAARRIARMATELLDADGAVVWLQGPGRLLCAGSHGAAAPAERAIGDDSVIEHVLLTGSVDTDGGEVVLPLTASGGTFGAVTVQHPRRRAASFVESVLQVFGAQAGYTLERLRAAEHLIDARFVDPVTGIGNRMAATASLATMRAGDAVLLVAVDELDRIRACEGDARVDLVLGQLGLYLRTATRAGDVLARFGEDVFFIMLRDLHGGAEVVVDRLLESWQAAGTFGTLRAGAALHSTETTPLETLDRASSALESTQQLAAA